ncbi:MAG: hypothetical protein KGZ83_01170 [Sulfuricella sp.]|nr:hypothetical protein [Sulfuricella sp.]
MQAYKTYARVDSSGRLSLENLPFAEGALVEVLVVDPHRSAPEREESWRRLMRQVQELPQVKALSDADIADEIDAYRETR